MMTFGEKQKNIWLLMMRTVMVGALLIISLISICSEPGVHPDEFDVRACMDWGMTHWIWPDMRTRGIGLGDTYSYYGYTKVCNYSPYFLVMGKVAYVFARFMDVLPYYRMPNLLLGIGLAIAVIRRVRTRPYVMLAFGICVQAWYVFSYVTADAMDFVLAFVSIMLLADRGSVLWKTIDGECLSPRRITLNCVLLGLTYGLMLLGKYYYYANMVLTFVVLVEHLVRTEPGRKRSVFGRYLIILGVCLCVWLARFGLDVRYYGTNKAEVKMQMAEEYASPDKKPSTPPEDQDVTWHMASKGYSIADFFEINDRWLIQSFRSFAGSRITNSGDGIYYWMMLILYLFIYAVLGTYAWREGHRIAFLTVTALNVGGIIASVLNSYLIDSQPQGRYLLPILLSTSFLGSRSRKLWDNIFFRGAVALAACLAVIYFGLVDVRKLIDLGYVRGLLAGICFFG